MKTFIFAPLAVVLLFLSACSNYDLQTQQIENTQSDGISNSIDLEQFMKSVDSLNACYSYNSSRGLVSDLGKILVDQAGRAGGRVIGRWLGSAIGAAAANPAIAVIGYVGGQSIGGFIGYHLSSAAVDLLFYEAGYYSAAQGKLQIKVNYSICPSEYLTVSDSRSQAFDLRCDSLGYYHNYVMVRVNQNKQKYLTGGKLNMSLLYDDIMAFMAEVGIYSEPLTNNELVKTEVRNMCKELAVITLNNKESNGTNQELVDGLCDCLEDNYMYTASEISFFKNFTASVAKTCSNLSISEIDSYAKDLASTIRNSNIPTDYKYEISVSATTTINSALCWVQ